MRGLKGTIITIAGCILLVAAFPWAVKVIDLYLDYFIWAVKL